MARITDFDSMGRVPLQLLIPLCKHPRLFGKMARGVYKKYGSAKMDYWDPEGRSNSLWLVSMRITHRCNHRCKICGQWGEKGYNRTDGVPDVKGEVSLEDYKKMVDSILHLKPHIYITGGEPFLYKSLVPLVNYMKERGLSVQIVTNGVGLAKNAQEIVENEWDMLCVSLDGPREVHDKCRGLKGAYDTMQKGFRKIQDLKREMGKKKPAFYTLTTISDTNQEVLLDTLGEAQDLEPDMMVIYYSWFTSEELGKAYTRIIKREMGVEPFAWKSYVQDKSKMDFDKVVEVVEKVKMTKFKFPVVFVPQLKPEEIPTYYKEPENFMGWSHCLSPWFQIDIMPNGDVVNCRDFPDIIMGNILEKPLLEIYNDEPFRAFRKAIRKTPNGVFPTCSRCCGLMGY